MSFEKASAAFQQAHREDPRGEWSVDYHARLAHWVDTLAPNAPEALRLAAQAAHLRRWRIPRSDYPEGRTGYKKWRSALARFHAEQAALILTGAGYGDDVAARVGEILQKKRLKQDPDVQTFEDAICLVFLENELADFSKKHDEDKLIGIIQKTWAKMSSAGHAQALKLELPDDLSAMIRRALSTPP